MITKEELQKAAPQVMQRLLDLGAVFPEKGVVAGQAVASMFWEELGLDLRGPINDIDVFATAHDFESAGLGRQKPFRRSLPTAKIGNKIEQDSDAYDGVPFIAQRHEIRVLSTYTEGLMNYTQVNAVDYKLSSFEQSQIVVNGFDLNAVSVGIDLSTQNVVCSQGFLDFCEHHTLQAQTCFTPAHTLVRLAKKFHGQEIQGAVCDYAQQRDMLECAIMIQSNNGDHDDKSPSEFAMLRFGQKYKDLAKQYQEHLPMLKTYVWKKTENYSVQLNYFECAKRTSEIDLALIKGKEVLSPSAYRFMITQNFPQIHQVLHSNDDDKKLEILKALSVLGNTADQSTKEQEWFVTLQHHLCPQSIGCDFQVTHHINHIRLALGQPSMVHNLDNMTVLESMKIFNDEAIVSNMEHVEHVCDVFNSNVPFWKMMTEHFDMDAQDFLHWSRDKNSWSRKILGSYDYACTIETISMKADACRQANRKLLAKTLLDAIIFYKDDECFIKRVTEQWNKYYDYGVLGNNYINSLQDNRCVRSYAGLGVPLLSAVPLEERAMYCRQVEKILPPSPMTLTVRALSGLSVDDLLTNSSLGDIVSCLRSMSQKIQNEINELRCSHPPTDDDKNNICVNVSQLILPVQQFLSALTDHQLMQNHALVLRYAFALNKEATQKRLKKMDASLACMAVDWMKTLHQSHVTATKPSGYDGVEIVPLTENGDMAMLENIEISLHVHSCEKTRKKKM